MEARIPFLKEPIGAGDVVKAATSALGIKPCTPCEERRKRLNAAFKLMPREQPWGKYPAIPEGWVREASLDTPTKKLQLFRHTSGKMIIWNVTTGEYRDSHTFCCSERMRERVRERWEELCR